MILVIVQPAKVEIIHFSLFTITYFLFDTKKMGTHITCIPILQAIILIIQNTSFYCFLDLEVLVVLLETEVVSLLAGANLSALTGLFYRCLWCL